MTERQLGNIYEIRQYMFRAGLVFPKSSRLDAHDAARRKLSPLVLAVI